MIKHQNTVDLSLPSISGQALVEFAFVLPLLILLLVVIVDLGIIFYTQMTVTNAAWEGARAGATIVDPDHGDQEIFGAVQAAVYGLNVSNLKIEIDPTQDESPRNQPFPAPRGSPLSVTVQYPLELSLPKFILPITGKAVTRMEYQNPR